MEIRRAIAKDDTDVEVGSLPGNRLSLKEPEPVIGP